MSARSSSRGGSPQQFVALLRRFAQRPAAAHRHQNQTSSRTLRRASTVPPAAPRHWAVVPSGCAPARSRISRHRTAPPSQLVPVTPADLRAKHRGATGGVPPHGASLHIADGQCPGMRPGILATRKNKSEAWPLRRNRESAASSRHRTAGTPRWRRTPTICAGAHTACGAARRSPQTGYPGDPAELQMHVAPAPTGSSAATPDHADDTYGWETAARPWVDFFYRFVPRHATTGRPEC